jgi:hypothetical protein
VWTLTSTLGDIAAAGPASKRKRGAAAIPASGEVLVRSTALDALVHGPFLIALRSSRMTALAGADPERLGALLTERCDVLVED